MTPGPEPSSATRPAGAFRLRVFVAMMLVVSACTGLGLLVAQRQAAANVEAGLQQKFESALATLHSLQDLRHAALAERCRLLVRRPRIVAALEENALDVLYLTSADELRDLLEPAAESDAPAMGRLHALFYRFLDANGQVIPPTDSRDAGKLTPEEERQLSLPGLPEHFQLGYLRRRGPGPGVVDEIIAMPIFSIESNGPISALVVGFNLTPLDAGRDSPAIRKGIWLGGQLDLPGIGVAARAELNALISSADGGETSRRIEIDGAPHLLFSKRLNPGSAFAPAIEVCVFPLADLMQRQQRLRAQILGVGALLLLIALFVSHLISRRLAQPVEKLAVDSEEDRARRRRAEAELRTTHVELERAARFSADASHQLKTPVTVLRAGLEELLQRDGMDGETREEVDSLIHQTYRLGGVIEDLLLLSRMDSGNLQIKFARVDLGAIIETWLDDLSVLPDEFGLGVTTSIEEHRFILGERRYVELIVQNLLVNARKYNRTDGRIEVSTRAESGRVVLSIGNTGTAIPPEAKDRIFQRFHRGAAGEGIPGHGLGLNLARDLARLHRGELRLVRSEADWTVFEVAFLPDPSGDPILT